MNKKIIFLMALLFRCLPSQAQTVQTVVDSLIPQVSGIEPLIMAICYVSGIGLVLKAIFKLREMSESRGQIKPTTVILLFVAGGFLLALPTTVNIGIEAFGFDTAGQFKY